MIVVFILWLLLVLHRLVRNNGHVGTQLLDEVVRIMHLLLLLLHDIVSILVDELLFAELFFAHNLLLFHLLNLLLERLLHVQTQTCNYHLLLINVFHVQEVVDAQVEVLHQVGFECLRPLLSFQVRFVVLLYFLLVLIVVLVHMLLLFE
jgi:hypothetical protein